MSRQTSLELGVQVPAALVRRIKRIHARMSSHLRLATRDALLLGELLLRARQLMKARGDRCYSSWVPSACGFSYAQATRYVRLFEFAGKHCTCKVSDLPLTEAYRVAGIVAYRDGPAPGAAGDAPSLRESLRGIPDPGDGDAAVRQPHASAITLADLRQRLKGGVPCLRVRPADPTEQGIASALSSERIQREAGRLAKKGGGCLVLLLDLG